MVRWILAGMGCSWEPAPAPAPVVPEPPAPPPPPAVVQLFAGESTTCVRRADERLQCFGVLELEPMVLPGEIEVTDTAICARTVSEGRGQRRCVRPGMDQVEPTGFLEVSQGPGAAVGRDALGQVWSFRPGPEAGAELVSIPLPDRAVRVVSGGREPCALLANAELWCWDPYAALFEPPKPHKLADGVLAVDHSYLQICWQTTEQVFCRADGDPVPIPGLVRPTALAVGRLHGCALQDGVPACWGDGSMGQRAGGTGPKATPVPSVTGAIALDAGADHTCALTAEGELACWGVDRGQLALPR